MVKEGTSGWKKGLSFERAYAYQPRGRTSDAHHLIRTGSEYTVLDALGRLMDPLREERIHRDDSERVAGHRIVSYARYGRQRVSMVSPLCRLG